MTKKPTAPPSPPQRGISPSQSPRSTLPDVLPLEITTEVILGATAITLYGPGGIGKTTLAAHLPGAFFFDLEQGTKKFPVARDGSIESWPDLRGKLAAVSVAPPEWMRSVVIDSLSVAEELAKEYVIETRRTDKGKKVDSIEGFGWGKGWQFVHDEFNGLLADLDRIRAKGLNVCLIAHECTTEIPNPAGIDYIRWEPHLYAGDKKERGSVRKRIKNWSDELVFINYDYFVNDDGKAQGSGTRTIYTEERPTHMAKTRTRGLELPFTLEDPGALWRALGIE